MINHYSSSLPGAPGHPGNTVGSLALLLRQCLVTGWVFGQDTYASAGWDEPFSESANFAAFQSLVGSRQLFQIDDNMANPDGAYARAGESLAAADGAMNGQWGGTYFGKWYNGVSATEWHVIADTKTCYVLLRSQYGLILHGFGEFDSLVPDDSHNSFLSGHSSSALPNSAVQLGLHNSQDAGNLNYAINGHRAPDGSWAPKMSLASVGRSGVLGGNNYSDLSLSNAGLGFKYTPCFVYSDSDNAGGNTWIHGQLRGIYQPLANRPYNHLETFVEPVTGKTMMCVHIEVHSTYAGSVIFDMTGPW